MHGHLRAAKEAAVERTLPRVGAAPDLAPHPDSLDEELDAAAQVRWHSTPFMLPLLKPSAPACIA